MFHGTTCNGRTYPTNCRYCSRRVFVFSCDCNCCVFFEELGPPWPRHCCPEYLIERYGFSADKVELLVRRRAEELRVEPPAIDHLFKAEIVSKKDWAAPIIAVEPTDSARRVVGIVREAPIALEPLRKLKLNSASIAARQISKRLPARVHQVTVHAAFVGAAQIESYTFWIANAAVSANLVVGSLIAVELTPLVLPGIAARWVTDAAEQLDGSLMRN